MKAICLFRSSALLLPLSLLCWSALGTESTRIKLLRTPDDGIQPQAAIDSKGIIHLIYYKGAAGAGDIFYVRQEPGQEGFSKPIPVNSQAGSAIAAGSIRGAQLALGKNGRVHVAWDGMGKGAQKITIGGKSADPLLYTRLNDASTAFEPERNLITYARGLDGGSSLAADTQGNVYVFWHAPQPGNTNGEAGRAVWVARSSDEGKTFAPEAAALGTQTGVCACCGMRAFADTSGAVYVLYRAASEKVNRDEILLVSRRPGANFEVVSAHKWKVATCPMSSASLSEGKETTLAAWETAGQIYFASVNPKTMQVSRPIAPPGGMNRKHPVAVGNRRGETLLVWAEGTGWAKGGTVAWQLYDQDGKSTAEKGRANDFPAWSLPTAVAKPDDTFVIVY